MSRVPWGPAYWSLGSYKSLHVCFPPHTQAGLLFLLFTVPCYHSNESLLLCLVAKTSQAEAKGKLPVFPKEIKCIHLLSLLRGISVGFLWGPLAWPGLCWKGKVALTLKSGCVEVIWDVGIHDTTTHQIFAKVLLWATSCLVLRDGAVRATWSLPSRIVL